MMGVGWAASCHLLEHTVNTDLVACGQILLVLHELDLERGGDGGGDGGRGGVGHRVGVEVAMARRGDGRGWKVR